MEVKIISRKTALEEKLSRYFTGKPCKRGHIAERYTKSRACVECSKIGEKKYSQTENGKQKRRLKQRRYYLKNIDEIRERDKVRNNNPERKLKQKEYKEKPAARNRQKIYNKNYRAKNLEKLLVKDREYSKKRRNTDPDYVFVKNLRRRIILAIKNQNTKKNSPTLKLLGCSIELFKKHLEKQFYPHPDTGEIMTWENHSLHGWHIDHIKPLSKFNLKKESEQKKAFNYRNCQPLWAHENLSKGSK